MRPLKKLLASLFLVVVITALILWALAKSVKPETVKSYVSTQLSALTHQNAQIEGDISWRLFPRPAIKITHIQIGEKEMYASHYSLKLENLLFNLKITPLLRGKLVFHEMKVDGFKVNINTDLPSITIKTNKVFEAQNDAKINLAEQFAIERFLLIRGQINIIGKQRKITLSGLQIGAEQFNLQHQFFPVQFKNILEITNNQEKTLKTQVNFKGSMSLSPSLFSNPLATLRNTPLDGQLSLQNLRIRNFKITKISAHTKTEPGVLILNPLTLNLYKGESIGDLSYEFASKKLVLNQTATNLDSSKLLSDLLNKSLFRGAMDFSLHAQTNLQNKNWQENTAGNGSFTIKNGVMELINLNKLIEQTSLQINNALFGQKNEKKQAPQLGQFDNSQFFKGGTNFKLLTFQYQLRDETLTTNSLVLQTDKLQLKGEGCLNLKNENLTSRLFAKVTLADKGIDKIQELLGGSFPIEIGGSLTEPTISPDLQKINPLLTQIWLKETLTEPVKKVGHTIKTIIKTGQQLL